MRLKNAANCLYKLIYRGGMGPWVLGPIEQKLLSFTYE
jgi:hypothetical protein